MATLGIGGIAAALNVLHASKFAKQFREDSTILNLLDVVQAPAGAALVFSAKFGARQAGGAVADGDDMADVDFDSHRVVQGTLPWTMFRAGVKVSDGAVDIAAGQTGNGYDGGLIQTEIDDAIGKIRNDVSAHLFSGNPGASPAQIGGLARLIDSSDDNYAGIDTGDNTDWLSSEESLSTSFTLADLHTKVIRPILNKTGRMPDFLLCGGTLFDYIAGLVDSNADTMQTMIANGPYGFLQASVGARILVVKGVPVIEDRHCTASTIYGITRSALRLRFIPVARPAVTPAEVAAAVQALTGFLPAESDVAQRMAAQAASLSPVLVPLDKTGLSTKLMLRTPLFQLEPRRRDALSKAVVS